MGERVPVKITPKKQIQSQPLPTLQDDPPSITDFSVTKKNKICSPSNEHSLRNSWKGKFRWETRGLASVSTFLIKSSTHLRGFPAHKPVISRVPCHSTYFGVKFHPNYPMFPRIFIKAPCHSEFITSSATPNLLHGGRLNLWFANFPFRTSDKGSILWCPAGFVIDSRSLASWLISPTYRTYPTNLCRGYFIYLLSTIWSIISSVPSLKLTWLRLWKKAESQKETIVFQPSIFRCFCY